MDTRRANTRGVALGKLVIGGHHLTRQELLGLTRFSTTELAEAARIVRDAGFGNIVTYSKKVFVPVTQLCRDVCHYCTFAKTPKQVKLPYMTEAEVLEVARQGKAAGCNEVLLTLGEKPELRYDVAREWLAEHGFASTVQYVAHLAQRILDETGLLPHANLGTLTEEELRLVRPVCPSIGIMLETSSTRLCEPGMPHYGSPDKHPEQRLNTLRWAGEARLATTTGILVGIGETVDERVDSILAIRSVHEQYGNIQEVIVQNFRAKPGTKMAVRPDAEEEEFVRTIAISRLALGSGVSIQAPPNLSPRALRGLIDAGINDWGGVSPVTLDHVNPEAPWPHVEVLGRETAAAGKTLVGRLTIYPKYLEHATTWLDSRLHTAVLRLQDATGLARESDWTAGAAMQPPAADLDLLRYDRADQASAEISEIVERCRNGGELDESDVVRLFEARGPDFAFICRSADTLRKSVNSETVSYVVTRNINYTNVCTFSCKFCAFSKGRQNEDLRGKPYDVPMDEVGRRTLEAWHRGATEVCMQGGIHPDYTGNTYLEICRTVKSAVPEIHVHAFSPLEVYQGAKTLGVPVEEFLKMLKSAGLGTLPGTAAEVLDDEVRKILCPDKLTTKLWLEIVEAAHTVGLKTTATIMFGHVDRPEHWARHLLAIRSLQRRTGGFTEFVPLPFVAQEAPIYRKGLARPGPTFRETVLMHAVARLTLHPFIKNVQTSWVKLGREGTRACLAAGANDLGGTLMNESITRAAGAVHGQEATPETLESWIVESGRIPEQRTTTYSKAGDARRAASFGAAPVESIITPPPVRRKRLASEPVVDH
ncbi:5-amino-6-(D-ribitylamino)uracil--L-tyrosine 4-hydroxyphenyl transferase CofH [Paraburkholderia sp. SIMBA_030]|uniref:5-amino-6-(D-ribitylamino)uracil--L-tyrosine 4-hydroxyphenyl transferase CofH n=1 Tax=Paraburkholderia sp. SIMBA_030 TaxID=3085773 RepID=UPI003979A8E9